MDLEQPTSSSAGRSGLGRGKTSAAMKKAVTQNPVQPSLSSLNSDTKMKILASEMELLNDFLLKKHGVRVLNLKSVHFQALHAQTSKMDRIKRSLDASVADADMSGTRANDERGGDDLDETLIVVKKEPNWTEEDTLVVGPGEEDLDERADSVERNVATVSEPSGLNIKERTHASLPEPSPTNNRRSKKHKCSYCDKVFSQVSNKTAHQRTHTRELSFKCQFCPKAFAVKCSKIRHERIHNGEKPFSCQFCPKTFSDRTSKISHERSHGDDRPFSCELCDASFRHLRNKTAHMRTHTREKPFQCEECEARVGSKQDKMKHMRTHTGEKPFHCEYCDKRFNQSSNLSTHLRIHTNERPYACSTCSKGFHRSADLRSHEKTHRK